MTSGTAHDGHVVDFLAMLTAERGASQNTIEAYANDLDGFLGFLSARNVAPAAAASTDIQAYLALLAEEGQAPSSRARRLSAVKQYYRFLTAGRAHRHRSDVRPAGSEKRRALPKVLSIAEVDRLLAASERRSEGQDGRALFPRATISLPARNALCDRNARFRACRATARRSAW